MTSENKHPNQYTKGADDENRKTSADKSCKSTGKTSNSTQSSSKNCK